MATQATPFERESKLISDARIYVKRIQDVLQKRSNQDMIGINISEIVVGGSMGQGTTVHGHYDIDLVILSTDLHPTKFKAPNYKGIVLKIKTCVEREIRDIRITTREIPDQLHGWKFTIGFMDVDLQISPYWEKPEDLYDYLKEIDEEERIPFSCGTVKLLNDLVKYQPPRVRLLITRFKAWRNETWPEEINGCPKSHLITMLVIIAYNRVPKAGKMKVLASKVTREIKHLVREITENLALDLHVPGEDQQIMRKYRQCLPAKPRILDPIDIFDNLYKRGLRKIEPESEDSYKRRWTILNTEIGGLDLAVHRPEAYTPTLIF